MKWDDSNYVTAYRLARGKMTDRQIRQSIGASETTFKKWLVKYPALRKAIDEGRDTSLESDHRAVMVAKMDDETRELWDQLNSTHSSERTRARTHLLVAAKRTKQLLYAQSLIRCDFHATRAREMVGVSRKTVQAWTATDPRFKRLLEAAKEAKKDLYESALVKLVAAGSEAATLFANRTVNRDRGYGDHATLDINQTVEDRRAAVEIDKLPLELRRQLLEALSKSTSPPAPLLEGRVAKINEPVDAEFEVKKARS